MSTVRDYSVSSIQVSKGKAKDGSTVYSFNAPGAAFHKATADGRGYVNTEFDLNPALRPHLAEMQKRGIESLEFCKPLSQAMVAAIAAVPASVRAAEAAAERGIVEEEVLSFGTPPAAAPVAVETVDAAAGPVSVAQASARCHLEGRLLVCSVRVARMLEALDARDAAGKPAQRVKVSAWIAANPPAGAAVLPADLPE